MRRRIEVRETVIAPGAIVRVKKTSDTRLTDLMARWEVLSVDDEDVTAKDVEDEDDVRSFKLEDLERVKGGESVVTGYVFVREEFAPLEVQYEDDPYDDADEEIEYPSLFDDPIKLQEEEDLEDEDA